MKFFVVDFTQFIRFPDDRQKKRRSPGVIQSGRSSFAVWHKFAFLPLAFTD